jgi:flagellar hook-length control protein FliK
MAPASSAITRAEETSDPLTKFQATAAAPESVAPRVKGQRAQGVADTTPMTASRAQETLEQAAPGVQLRFQFSEGTPTASAKPALTELLSLPKPEIQAPKLPTPAARTEVLPAREVAPPPPPPPIKATEVAPSGPTQTLQAPGIREAAVAITAKVEPLPGKSASASGAPLSLSGTTTLVKGSTPVPGLESPQGAKSNATFAQLDGSIRWLLKSQEKGAEIQLNPESLGRVVIKLRVEGGEVHARLWASEASTVPILQDHKAALEASLRQQGLSLGSFDLQQGHRGHDAPASAPSDLSGSGPGIATPQEKKQDLPSVAPALLGGARLIEVFA